MENKKIHDQGLRGKKPNLKQHAVRKSTKEDINALIGMYSAIGTATIFSPAKQQDNVQLKMFDNQ